MKSTDVFISYSHKDKALADAVCHHFENRKLKCWIAPRDIRPGAAWAESIATAITQCEILLLIFSGNSNMSKQVLREVELAVTNGVIVVPIKVEDIKLSAGMAYYLATVHWLDIVDDALEEKLEEITQAVINIKKSGSDEFPIKNIQLKELTKTGGVIKPKKKKRVGLITSSIAIVVLVIAVFTFRDNIFAFLNQSESETSAQSALANQPTIGTTEYLASPTLTQEPTPEPTAEPTPTPTATVDPNIAPDTVVDIPDVGLKTIVLKTLDDSGHAVVGNITAKDMLYLTEICLISPEALSNDEVLEQFSDAIISDITVKSLEGLQYAKNLEMLVIVDNELSDISALSQTYNLEYVNLGFNKISDISAFTHHSKITTLHLLNNDIEDITALQLLYKMEQLDISTNPVKDLSSLSGMLALVTLHINELDNPDLDVIALLTNLEFLAASGSEFETKDMALFDDLDKLEYLILENNNIASFSYWKPSPVLKQLLISGNFSLNDLSPLLEITTLKELGITQAMKKINSDTIETLEKRNCEIVIR